MFLFVFCPRFKVLSIVVTAHPADCEVPRAIAELRMRSFSRGPVSVARPVCLWHVPVKSATSALLLREGLVKKGRVSAARFDAQISCQCEGVLVDTEASLLRTCSGCSQVGQRPSDPSTEGAEKVLCVTLTLTRCDRWCCWLLRLDRSCRLDRHHA